MNRSGFILAIIVVAQFCCTSLWFAGNGVMADLINSYGLREGALGSLTSAVQLGFITGTFLFAALTIADRFSPSRVFLCCALAGAALNLGMTAEGNTLGSLLLVRFGTGFFLAGIYPVGMKIASDHFKEGLGKSLGFLVGALVVGTALPHLLKNSAGAMHWKSVIQLVSAIATVGGLLMVTFVPDGPYRKAGVAADFSAFFRVFRKKELRSSAFGYFGHMWELYTFWAFVPVMLSAYLKAHPPATLNIPLWSFLIIATGGGACVAGGFLSQRFGVKRTATTALFLSCTCCLLAPFLFQVEQQSFFLAFLLFWGMVVIADSPLFSTLVAQSADPEIKGTALTIVNGIGFSITIISIQLLAAVTSFTDAKGVYALLAIGPILGLLSLRRSG